MNDILLERLVLALERLSPPPPAAPDPDAPAYGWINGGLVPKRFAPLPITLLTGIDAQRDRRKGNRPGRIGNIGAEPWLNAGS